PLMGILDREPEHPRKQRKTVSLEPSLCDGQQELSNLAVTPVLGPGSVRRLLDFDDNVLEPGLLHDARELRGNVHATADFFARLGEWHHDAGDAAVDEIGGAVVAFYGGDVVLAEFEVAARLERSG